MGKEMKRTKKQRKTKSTAFSSEEPCAGAEASEAKTQESAINIRECNYGDYPVTT